GVPARRRHRRPQGGPDRGSGNPRRADGGRRRVRAHLPGPAGDRDSRGSARVTTRALLELLRPWRARLVFVAVAVLAAAALEVAPPLIIRAIIDAHLIVRQPVGLPWLALLYLLAAAAVQVTTFLYSYLAATM